MIIIPAIDLKEGKVVRLFRGDYNQEKVYSNHPAEVAASWQEQGAQILHIVDLDGSLAGELRNLEVVKKIAKEVNVSLHVGGGIRTTSDIKTLFQAGVTRVIIGTKAFTDDKFLQAVRNDNELRNKLDSIIVSIDTESYDGFNYFIKTSGWTKNSSINAFDAVREIEQAGIKMVVVTDIMRDGTLSGPNASFLEAMLRSTSMRIITSGGISNLQDIKTLKGISLEYNNLYGAITGKALYEGALNLREAISYAK